MSKVLICGDRWWGRVPDAINHYSPVAQARLWRKAEAERVRLRDWCDEWHFSQSRITQVIEGEAKGADTWGRVWGESRGIDVRKFHAQWKVYGKAAGPMRNREQLAEGEPNYVFAFHNNLMESRGTLDMVTISTKARVTTWVISIDDQELR